MAEPASHAAPASPLSAGLPPVVDLVYGLRGRGLPTDYRSDLWLALREVLPWFESEALGGIVGIGLTPTGSGQALLSRRAKLTLRVPRLRLDDACALEGHALHVANEEILIGEASRRELQASPTLYSALVMLEASDELAFVAELESLLLQMGVDCRCILGRRRSLRHGEAELGGFPVALHGCRPRDSLLLQAQGVGRERRLGCGIFLPHKKIEGVE